MSSKLCGNNNYLINHNKNIRILLAPLYVSGLYICFLPWFVQDKMYSLNICNFQMKCLFLNGQQSWLDCNDFNSFLLLLMRMSSMLFYLNCLFSTIRTTIGSGWVKYISMIFFTKLFYTMCGGIISCYVIFAVVMSLSYF